MQLHTSLRILGGIALLASLAGCSATLTEADIQQALTRIEQASQQKDITVLEQILAPQAQIVIDMRAVDVPEPLQLNKSQYLQLVQFGWAQASTQHHYARSNTRIHLAPGGKTATASATIQETATVQGQTMTSTTDEVATFSLVDGKLQVTQVQGTVLSMQ